MGANASVSTDPVYIEEESAFENSELTPPSSWCGEGTIFENDKCILDRTTLPPDVPPSSWCGEGTIFSEDLQKCSTQKSSSGPCTLLKAENAYCADHLPVGSLGLLWNSPILIFFYQCNVNA